MIPTILRLWKQARKNHNNRFHMSDPSPYQAPSARIPAKWQEQEEPRIGGVKKALMILGGVFAVLIVIFAAGFGVLAYKGHGLDESGRRYAIEAVRAIVTDWDQQAMQTRLSPEFKALVRPGDLEQWFGVYRKLGKLRQSGEVQGQAFMGATLDKGKMITGQYRFTGQFENGQAEILVSLIQHDGQWQLYGFRVNSEAFMKK
jgi:hypothetical protein